MPEIKVKSLAELHSVIRRDLGGRQKAVKQAVSRTATQGARFVRRNVPVAHGELRNSIKAMDGHRIVADAPHAAPVETGSRPHWPPLAPLIAWVKLRGMQGLTSPKRQARLPGTTTKLHAGTVAGAIKAHSVATGYADWSGGATSVDAPEAVARAIQAAIAKHGTKPHWYMRGSIFAVELILDVEIRKGLDAAEAKANGGGGSE